MDGKWLASRLVGDLRSRRNLSQRALGRLAGVPQPTIAEIEAGRREPSLTLLSKLAEATGQMLDVRLLPIERHSAVGTAQRLTEVLRSREDRADSALRQEDAALGSYSTLEAHYVTPSPAGSNGSSHCHLL